MSQGVPQAGLPLRAALMTRRIPGSRDSEARIVVGIPGEAGSGQPYAVSLESAAFQAPSYNEKHRHEQQLRIDPAQGGLSEARATFRLSPGRYELRVAGEAGERTGSVFLDVDLDTKSPLVLSSPGVTLSGAPADSAPLTVQRVFRAGDRPRLLGQVVRRDRGIVERAGVDLSITDTEGRVVMVRRLELGAPAFNRDGIADLDLELPLQSIEPGEYLAAVTVTSGKDEAVAAVRFERR
jgi:hypothetical protein